MSCTRCNYFASIVDNHGSIMGFCAMTGDIFNKIQKASKTTRIQCDGKVFAAVYPVDPKNENALSSPVEVPPEESVDSFDDWSLEDILEDDAFSEAVYSVAPWSSRRILSHADQFRPSHFMVDFRQKSKEVLVPFEHGWASKPEYMRIVI